MLSRKTVNNTGQGDYQMREASSEPHIVVGCPYCQTKFAVEGGLVASYEAPTFHCSRCDAVFEYTPLRQSVPTNRRTEEGNTNTAHQQTTIRPSDFSLGDLDSNTNNNTRSNKTPWVEQSAGRSLLGLSDTATSPFSITREEFVARAERLGIDSSSTRGSDIPREKNDQGTENSFDVFALFDTPRSNERTEDPKENEPLDHVNTSHNTQGSPQNPPPTITSRQSISPFPIGPKQPEVDNSTPDNSTPDNSTPDNGTPTEARRGTLKSNSPQLNNRTANHLQRLLLTISAKNRDLFRMLRPLIKVTAGVVTVALLTHMMPKTVDDVFGAVIPSALSGKRLHVPPTELVVHDLTFNFEKTITGDTVPVVRGMVSNSGKISFQNVMVEAIGFDSRGATVMRIKAPLRSALNREKLSDISVEDARKFQTTIHTVASTIKANETLPFTIAMLSEKSVNEEISFFSARIFSFGK